MLESFLPLASKARASLKRSPAGAPPPGAAMWRLLVCTLFAFVDAAEGPPVDAETKHDRQWKKTGPVRKKLANLTGLHGLVSNKNNGSAANRIKTIFASAPVSVTVNTTNATLPVPAPPCATVACVTWNLAATSPSSKDAKFLERLRRHDLVCICVQELSLIHI